MGLPSNTNALQNGFAQGYQIGRSLRFRSSASAYLNRTPASASNRKTWTWSGWVKRGSLGSAQTVFGASAVSPTNDSNLTGFSFDAGDTFSFGGGATVFITTTQVFRDPSAWYHIVVALDTTQATASNRVKMYVNGVQVTAFSTSNYTTLNLDTAVNSAVQHDLASLLPFSGRYFDGYLAEVNFIDGQALTPSSFGLYDSNGIWQPIKYTGTYGTNGFYLPFSNTTSTTTLVADASGNGNNWTPNNISLTAGTTYDSMLDSPTVSNASSNYAVMNPLDSLSGTASNGNLLWTAGAAQSDIRGTIAIPSSGKFYMECTVGSTTNASSGASFGLATSTVALNSSNAVSGLYQLYASSSGYLSLNGTNVSSSLGVWTAGDILQIAVDVDNTKMWLGKNNTWYDSSGGSTGNPSTGANATSTTSMVGLFPFSNCYSNNVTWNMGQRPFTYTPPSGYNALNTANLPQPLISNGANYMAATLYTGNGGTQTINNGTNTTIGTSFQPDFVWIKNRAAAVNHQLQNSNAGWQYGLNSNNTNAEYTDANAITGATSSGWSMNNNYNSHNQSGVSYVGWNWKAGAGTTSTNTSGSITSTVSANTTAGFSVVTYTGTGANATVGHGLGVAPSMIISKSRSLGTENWNTFHTSLAAGNVVQLNTTIASTSAPTMFTTTLPTSSVFSVGTNTGTNGSGSTYVAYCFAAVSGYSAFGSYTGNGSSDGPFIFTGHRPRWVMVKKSSAIGNWLIFDTSRSPFNVNDDALFPNLSNAETTTSNYNNDFLSNGFKIRTSDGSWNDSGVTYIYASFAESPFNISRGR